MSKLVFGITGMLETPTLRDGLTPPSLRFEIWVHSEGGSSEVSRDVKRAVFN